MKPAPDQDLSKLKPVSPRFSGALPPPSVLSLPPKGDEYSFTDGDRDAVREALVREPAAGGNAG
jgi:hypothetical protein